MGGLALLDEMSRPQAIHAELFDFNVDTILSCARALKRTQAYNGCFSPLQRTQSAVESEALVAKDVTRLVV